MASVTDICNLALQKLGAGKITSIDENSVPARACKVAYEHCRDKVLRAHPWRCAIERASIAADDPAPDWGKDNSYTLPSDCLRVMPPYPEMNFVDLDWEIEGRKLYSDDVAPLYLRYIKRLTDANTMDTLLREVIACEMADQMCEELTQSNAKKAAVSADKKAAVAEARRTNAIESIASQPPEDTWVTVRD